MMTTIFKSINYICFQWKVILKLVSSILWYIGLGLGVGFMVKVRVRVTV